MNLGNSQNTMPAILWCCLINTIEGRHGFDLGYGLDGSLSTVDVGVRMADVGHVPSQCHRSGVVPAPADGDQTGPYYEAGRHLRFTL